MSKNKNKGSKKNKPSPELLDTATVELKRFRRFAKQVRKLSTAQKVVGSLGLLAAGYAFLATRTPNAAPTVAPAADKPDLSGLDTTSNPVSSPSTPKTKRTKPARTSKHSPFSKERP